MRAHVWRVPVCIVTDPELIQEVLVRQADCFVKSAGLRATERAFGRGLLTSDGALWRRQRRTMQPAFQARRVESYRRAMEVGLRRLQGAIGDGGVRDVHRDMTDLCFEVLAESLFGEDMAEGRRLIEAAAAALHGFHQHYARWIGTPGGLLFALVRAASTAAGRPDFVVDPSRLPTREARQFRELISELDAYAARVIAGRRERGGGEDLLSMLLEATDEEGRPLPDRQIRDEVVTMFFAGHETGAAALTWALWLVARHPEVGAKIAAAEDPAPLVEQVFAESLRLYPPAHRISRTTVRTCRLGSEELRAGTEVVIPQWAVQRSPRWFDDPDEFRPERWTPELERQLPRFAYFPFGGGGRTCIGNHFALAESHLVLQTLLRAYELRAVSGEEVRPFLGVTLQPEGGSLRLELRRRSAAAVRA